jgi:uncharacterized RDD family membrane protein YckC
MPCTNHASTEGPLWQCSRCARPFCMDCIVQIGGQTYCAECKSEAMRDLRSGVPVQQLELATIGRRFSALFIDGLILTLPVSLVVGAVIFAMVMATGAEGPSEDLMGGIMIAVQLGFSLLLIGMWIVYEGVMLSKGGQTYGKRIMHVKVVTAEGNEITRGQAYTRAAIRQLLSAVPCLGLIDYLLAFGQEKTTIHDQVAKTRVVVWNG